MQTAAGGSLVTRVIFNSIERNAPAIARDIAQAITGIDREVIDRATDIDWIQNTVEDGQPCTEPYIAIYRAMRTELGLPVEY